MHEILSLLELKVRNLLIEKRNFSNERDALAQKIIELQDKVDFLQKKLDSLKLDYEAKENDVLLASMVVDDLLQELDESSNNKNYDISEDLKSEFDGKGSSRE
jgi:hypothetical protein